MKAIELFDRARVFEMLDLGAIQRLARNSSISDIRHAYNSLEKDLKKIAHHPTDSSTFRSRTWTGTISKAGGTVAGTVLLLLFLIADEFPMTFMGAGFLLIGIAVVAIAVILLAITMEYKLRKEFVKSYDGLSLPAKRERIRKITDSLIAGFAQRLEKLGKSPGDYPLALLHKDYSHLIVEKSKEGKSEKLIATAATNKSQKNAETLG